jgi:hypothetical protein
MSDINATLEKLLDSDINISASSISQGSDSHNYIRDVLKGKNDRDSLFPRLIEGDFLSGSYARGTKLKPLDDIDVMVVIDGAGLHVVKGGYVQDIEVRGSGKSDNPILQHMGPNSLLSSRTVMSLFQKALTDLHPNSKIRNDQQAVNVWLSTYGLGIDVVPCFHLIPRDGSQDHYYIPEGNGSDGWKTTNPKIDAIISSTLHDRHNKLMKKIVRLAKYWNTVSNANRLRSYHLETIVWHIFDEKTDSVQSLELGLINFFSSLDKWLANSCPDKTALGGPLDQYLQIHNRQWSQDKAQEALNSLVDTYITHPNDASLRERVWQQIFSNKLNFS